MALNTPISRKGTSRTALALVLASVAGLAALPAPVLAAKKAEPAKVTFSPEFQKVAADLDKQLDAAKTDPAVTAATAKSSAAKTPAAKQAAIAEVDAALGGMRAKLDAAAASVKTTGDKLKLGDMYRVLGNTYDDPATQHKGLVMMLESGGVTPEQNGQIQFLAGVTAYQAADYPEAIKYLKPAKDSGYKDPQGLLDQVLADSYKRSGNSAAVMDLANQDIAAAKAAGTKPSETSIRTALQAAYDAKNKPAAVDLSSELVQTYPSPDTWNVAIRIVRDLTPLAPQDNLDLMRLMARTNAMSQRPDYLEYIQNADPRRLPGETLKVIDAGVASGKLQAGDAFVKEARQIATGRLAADRASLVGLERDARSGSASAVTVTGLADAFLSYDQPAKAEELYRSALTKPGVDKDRVLTRLGIAQADQGKYADAKASFAQVRSSNRVDIAKLWAAYATTKSTPATASAQ